MGQPRVHWIRERDLSRKVPVSSEMLLLSWPFPGPEPGGSPGSLWLSCSLPNSLLHSGFFRSASRLALWLLDGSCHLPTVPGVDRRVVGRSRVRERVCLCRQAGEHQHVDTCGCRWAHVGGHPCLLGMECCSWLLPKASILTFIFLKKSLPLWEVDRLSLAPQEG